MHRPHMHTLSNTHTPNLNPLFPWTLWKPIFNQRLSAWSSLNTQYLRQVHLVTEQINPTHWHAEFRHGLKRPKGGFLSERDCNESTQRPWGPTRHPYFCNIGMNTNGLANSLKLLKTLISPSARGHLVLYRSCSSFLHYICLPRDSFQILNTITVKPLNIL